MREVAVHLKKLKGAWNNQCKLCRLIHLNHQSVLENQLKVVLHRKRMVLDINHQQKVLFWSKKVKKKFRRICTHLQPNRMKALLQINRQCWLKLIKMNHRELFRQKVRHILILSIKPVDQEDHHRMRPSFRRFLDARAQPKNVWVQRSM